MVRAVLDTNVILAALLSRRGASFEILQQLRRGGWRMVLSNHLLLEYEEVLKRSCKITGFSFAETHSFLNALCQAAECFELEKPNRPRLADYDDEPLLRLAEASGANLIATHNLRHLAAAAEYGVRVLPPRDFLRILTTIT